MNEGASTHCPRVSSAFHEVVNARNGVARCATWPGSALPWLQGPVSLCQVPTSTASRVCVAGALLGRDCCRLAGPASGSCLTPGQSLPPLAARPRTLHFRPATISRAGPPRWCWCRCRLRAAVLWPSLALECPGGGGEPARPPKCQAPPRHPTTPPPLAPPPQGTPPSNRLQTDITAQATHAPPTPSPNPKFFTSAQNPPTTTASHASCDPSANPFSHTPLHSRRCSQHCHQARPALCRHKKLRALSHLPTTVTTTHILTACHPRSSRPHVKNRLFEIRHHSSRLITVIRLPASSPQRGHHARKPTVEFCLCGRRPKCWS